MSLCDDCRSIKFAEYLKGMQKLDKFALTRRNISRGSPSGSADFRSDVTKSAFALFKWILWSIRTKNSIRRAVKEPTESTPSHWPHGILLANLNSRLKQSPLKDCALCTILSKIRVEPIIDRVHANADDMLIGFRYFEDITTGGRWNYEGTPSDVIILIVLAGGDWSTGMTIPDHEYHLLDAEPVGFLTCRLKDCESDLSRFIPAKQPTINFGKISQAIQECRESHPECRNKRITSQQVIEISLFDCYNRTLIHTTSSEEYVALSYVWGRVSAGSLESTTLPRTIEDAIQVTQELGFRYIWFDQFCVNQHDNATKHDQIRTMGKVYEDAIVTLVAASGSDADAGLPGTPDHPYEIKPSMVVDGCIITEEAKSIDFEIQKSVWASRGWTFQEQFFSRRILVFSPRQVSFECGRTKYSPRFDTYEHESVTTQTKPRPVQRNLWSRLLGRSHEPSPQTMVKYRNLVNEFWSRHLSFAEDGIDAFTAVLEHLKAAWNAELSEAAKGLDTHESGMSFTAGIPHLLRQQAGSPDPSLGLFVQGLTWYCERSIKRRQNFPSWCWAGWTPSGLGSSNLYWHYGDGDWEPLIRNVFFKNNLGPAIGGVLCDSRPQVAITEPVPIAEYQSSSVPEVLIFDAPFVSVSAISWERQEDWPLLWGGMVIWDMSERDLFSNEYDFGGDRLNGVKDDFRSDLLSGVSCLVALSHQSSSKSDREEAVFMLLHRIDQYRHERIGLVHMYLDSLGSKVTRVQFHRDMEFRSWEVI